MDDVMVDVQARPATFATRSEHAWRAAVAAAVGTREVPNGVRFEVTIEFRLPGPVTTNDAWDLDNLVKPTLDALGGVIGWRRRAGVPQADDERVDRLSASKRSAGSDEPGATIEIVAIPSSAEPVSPIQTSELAVGERSQRTTRTNLGRAVAVGQVHLRWAAGWGPHEPGDFLAVEPNAGGEPITKAELVAFIRLAKERGFISAQEDRSGTNKRIQLTGRGENCLRVTGGDIERYRTGPWDLP